MLVVIIVIIMLVVIIVVIMLVVIIMVIMLVMLIVIIMVIMLIVIMIVMICFRLLSGGLNIISGCVFKEVLICLKLKRHVAGKEGVLAIFLNIYVKNSIIF